MLSNVSISIQIVQLLYDEKGKPKDYLFLDVNPLFQKYLGLTKKEIIGKKATELLTFVEPEWFFKFGEVVKTGQADNFEVFDKCFKIWKDISIVPLGENDKFVITYTDISERKGMEVNEALLSEISKELCGLTNIEDTMNRIGEKIGKHFGVPWCVFCELISDLENLECYGWNNEDVSSVCGRYRLRDYLTDEQIARNNSGEVTIVFDTQTDTNTNAEAYGKLNIRSFIIIPIIQNGLCCFQLFIADNKARKWLDKEVDLIKKIAECIWARLERARVDEELRESTLALDEANRLKEDIIESISDCFYVLDKNLRFTYVNKASEEVCGLPRADLIGRKIEHVLQGKIDISISKFEQVLRDKVKIYFEIYSKVLEKWSDVGVYPMRDGISVFFRDITESKKAEEALRKSREKALALVDELEEADKNKNEFINMLSHELRNPLAAIKGGIPLLNLTNGNEKNKKTIKILERQSEHLSKLVDDLLDVTRINTKKITLKIETVNLNTIVENSVEDMKQQFEEKGIKLLNDISTDPILVNVDSLRITQCVENILRNALKFTGEDGIVIVSLNKEGRNALLKIEDNGIGISPGMLEKIFEPFKQESNSFNSNNNMGLGLGLYIVKEYLGMHNGTISASSPGLGKGTTFTMLLQFVE